MNINYINKYVKYKNKYVKYINQHGGGHPHLISENNIVHTVYSLVDDISKNVMSEEVLMNFPNSPIESSGNKMTIHDIWNTIILNNKITKELDIKSTASNLKYIYIFPEGHYLFIIDCLKILSYNNIYTFTDKSYDNIPNRTLDKLHYVITTKFEGLFLYKNNENREYKITKQISRTNIIIFLLHVIYLILINKEEYIETIPINNFDNTNVWFGRKIKNNENYHFNNNNLILYICDKISNNLTRPNSPTWPDIPIIVYDELSLHIIWSHIVTYNYKTLIFIYSKKQYLFIDYCLKCTINFKITKKSDITKFIFNRISIDEIFNKLKKTNSDIILNELFNELNEGDITAKTDEELSVIILDNLLSIIRQIVLTSNKCYNTKTHNYNRCSKLKEEQYIGNIPEYVIEYTDNNLYKLYISDTLYSNIINYKNNAINLSKKIKIIIEFIKYIDIYNIVPIHIMNNIIEYITLCKVDPKLLDISKEVLINRNNDLSNFIKKTINYIDDIKNILDLFNIVIFIIFNNRYIFKDEINIFSYSYEKIFNNMKQHFNKNKYEVVNLIEYAKSNIDILLDIKKILLSQSEFSCLQNLPNTAIKNIYNRLNDLSLETKETVTPKQSCISFICSYLENDIQKICINNSYGNINNIFNKILEIYPSDFDITLLQTYSIYEIINYLIYNMTQYYIKPHMNYENINLLYELYNKVLIHLNELSDTTSIVEQSMDLKDALKQETQQISITIEIARDVQKIQIAQEERTKREAIL